MPYAALEPVANHFRIIGIIAAGRDLFSAIAAISINNAKAEFQCNAFNRDANAGSDFFKTMAENFRPVRNLAT